MCCLLIFEFNAKFVFHRLIEFKLCWFCCSVVDSNRNNRIFGMALRRRSNPNRMHVPTQSPNFDVVSDTIQSSSMVPPVKEVEKGQHYFRHQIISIKL